MILLIAKTLLVSCMWMAQNDAMHPWLYALGCNAFYANALQSVKCG